MVEDGVDVFLIGRDQSGIGEKILRVRFLLPGKNIGRCRRPWQVAQSPISVTMILMPWRRAASNA